MRQAQPQIAVCLLLTTIVHAAAALAEQPLAVADNAFGFRLFKELAKTHPAANICISPYSTATVLHMVGNGAAGKTKTEMQQVLGTTGLSFSDINAANRGIAKSRARENTPNVILTTANAIWYRQDSQVKATFIAINQQYYGATVGPLNFGDAHAVNVINAWASDKTQGKIRRIADGMIDPDNTAMFLANAIYFKGKWSLPFALKDTKEQPFHLRGGGEKIVPMMKKTETLLYRHGPGYQAIWVPYEGIHQAMFVILPDANSSPEAVLGALSGAEHWQREIKSGSLRINLTLPKFKVEYSVELRQPLESLGMKAAFSASSADFSDIAPKLFISSARHKTFVEVREEGTEAAAVTGLAAKAQSIPSEPYPMVVDRPFLFFIEDTQTGALLFMGVVFDPTSL